MYYQVYSNCCGAKLRNGIRSCVHEISYNDVCNCITELLDEFVDTGRFSSLFDLEDDLFCAEYERIFDVYLKFFKDNGFLEIGDYYICISDVDRDSISIPGSCGWTFVEV